MFFGSLTVCTSILMQGVCCSAHRFPKGCIPWARGGFDKFCKTTRHHGSCPQLGLFLEFLSAKQNPHQNSSGAQIAISASGVLVPESYCSCFFMNRLKTMVKVLLSSFCQTPTFHQNQRTRELSGCSLRETAQVVHQHQLKTDTKLLALK